MTGFSKDVHSGPILPCPFCGGDAETRVDNSGKSYVACIRCDAQSQHIFWDNRVDSEFAAIQRWNQRIKQ